MDPQTLQAIEIAELATTQLIETCRKNSPVYQKCVKAAAQVSRTGKWLLNATCALRKALKNPIANENQES